MNRTTLTVLGAALLLALTGCSSGQDDGIASAGAATSAAATSDEDKALEFAECMRDNGVDVPDPVPDGEGGFDYGVAAAGLDLDDPAFQEAVRACRDKLPGGGREALDDPEVQAQLREFAQCMRDNGVDFPDPDPDSGFASALLEMDRSSPRFQQAMDACRDKLPERGGR